jgi:hypothetical protein
MASPPARGETSDHVDRAAATAGTDRVRLQERIVAARAEVEANLVRLTAARSRLAAVHNEVCGGRSGREALHSSAMARLQSRVDSLPVIEQAKGILMAEAGCEPREAFDILRRTAERSHVTVTDLASEIVRRAAEGRRRPNRVAPRSPGVSEQAGPSAPDR